MTEKRTDTRFKPGQSGNPKGRTTGSRPKALVALDALGEGEAEAIVLAMIEQAKNGDATAGRMILDRVWPARRGARLQFDLPDVAKPEDLPDAIQAINLQTAEGDISPDEATLIVGLLDAQRRAMETSDLAARLAALEERMGKR
jgi:hypothetical protein